MFQMNKIKWHVLIFLLSIFLFNSNSYAIKTVFQGDLTGYTDEQIQYIAENNVAVISNSGPKRLAEIRSYNSELITLYYIDLIGLHNPPPKVQDLLWLDDEGRPVKHLQYGWYLADIRNPLWTNLLIDFLADKMKYYDGVMLDDTSILWLPKFSSIPEDYDEAEFYEALQTNISAIKDAFPDKIVTFNGYSTLNNDFTGVDFLQNADGISFEAFCYKFNGTYLGEEALLEKGIDFFSVSQFKSFTEVGEINDYQHRMFGISVYLLLSNDYSTYHYAGINHPKWQIYPEYQLNLGAPKGNPFEAFGGVIRYYEGGIVFVNPGTEIIQANLGSFGYQKLTLNGGGSWENQGYLSWEAISGETEILPESGIILKYLK